jgi:uncharacterized repeat protein (TIGR01451 family)
MRSKNTSPRATNRRHSLVFVGIFIILAAVVVIPLYSVRSSTLPKQVSNQDLDGRSARALPETAGIFSPKLSFPLLMPQTGTPSVATFDGTDGTTCDPAKTEFSLGQNVCATATNTGANRRFSWADPQGFVRRQASITSDPQNDHFDIPSTPTSTLSNGQVVSNIGNWRVNIISSRGALVTFATFVVKDPANATADLAVYKRAPTNSEQVQAGSNGSFNITAQNSGPDDAATVTLTDHVPANTTFVTMVQTSGQPNSTFTCDTVPNGLGNITCAIATFAAGASATFDFVYTVNAGTPAGTLITNTVSIASATTNELNNSDNSATASASVAPSGGTGVCTLTCADDIVTPANTTDENNNRGAIVHFTPTSSEGTCGVVTTDHCNDCFFPLGTTTVTTSTTTGDSCSFTVTVTETGSNATISCPANKTANANGDCEATVTLGTPTATGDNITISVRRSDGKPMYDCDINGENCVRKSTDLPFSAGITTVTWTATSHDSQGNETGNAACNQTVTVYDVTPPVITATDSTVPADANCQAAVPDYTNDVSDNCSCAASDNSQDCVGQHRITTTQSVAAGTLVGPGSHTIHLTANDGASNPGPDGIPDTADDGTGNTTEKDITFTVSDQTAPSINCPANITTSNDPGTCSATVNPGTATATDNCDTTPTITGTRSDNQPLNASYPKGTTTITWTATDDANNSSSCTQTVTVNDTESPTISCPGNITKNNDPGVCGAVVTYTTPVGSDNCPGASTAQTAGLPSGSTFPVGTTTNTFEVTDSSGNKTSCSFTVTVNDVENPTISCPASLTLEATCPAGAKATYTAPVGTDNCPGATTTRTAGLASGSVFPIGTTTVTHTVNDAHGHSASCSFTVTVLTPQATVQNLINSVNASSLNGTQKNGLVAKLNAALDAINQGKTNVACNKLSDFVNNVETLISHGDISAAQGNAWINSANHVRNTIGCTNNPCT